MPGGGAQAIDDANKALCKLMHDQGYSLPDIADEVYRTDGENATKGAVAYIIKPASQFA